MNKISMFELVHEELARVEAELITVIHSPVGLITEIGDHLVEAGGKRLRPALYLLCARSAKREIDDVLPMAVALELIHMATLVHDDVIDNSMTRRGMITANARWGNQISVLSGDYLFAKAFSAVAGVGGKMMKILTNTICVLCEGEVVQIQSMFDAQQSEEDYVQRIAKKTADFIAASCQLGGIAGCFSERDVQAFYQYGYSLGIAFQITDDILDITASQKQLGKPVGNDLRQGILTLPAIRAMQNSKYGQELRNIVLSKDMSDHNVERALEMICATDALDYSNKRVEDFLEKARTVLPQSLDEGVRKALFEISDFVGLRKY
ncbi:MAG: Trans-hexaprenyltranstransferase [Firmicutes bacterium]|nr:Trans-hexaprenyltranstransferase [Bacillota bacterium]